MAFPAIIDVRQGVQASDTTSWSLTYPTLAAGDLILFWIGQDGTAAGLPTATGFVTGADAGAASACRLCYGKALAVGTESGSFTVTLATAEQGCWKTCSVRGWEGTLGATFSTAATADSNSGSVEYVNGTNGTSGTPDPPSSTLRLWGAEETLWFAAACTDNGSNLFTSTLPTGYTVLGTSQANGQAAGATLNVAYKESVATNEDPSSFSIAPASDEWAANVIAVRQRIQPTFAGSSRAQAELAARGYTRSQAASGA